MLVFLVLIHVLLAINLLSVIVVDGMLLEDMMIDIVVVCRISLNMTNNVCYVLHRVSLVLVRPSALTVIIKIQDFIPKEESVLPVNILV